MGLKVFREKYNDMKENNDIDNLFKKGLESFEVSPSEQVWEGVEGTLFQGSKSIPFYRERWALVALLLLLLSVGVWFLFFNIKSPNSAKPVEVTGKPEPVVSKPSATTTATVKSNERVSRDESSSAEQFSNNNRMDNTSPSKNKQIKHSVVQFQKSELEAEPVLVQDADIMKKNMLEIMPSAGIYTLAALPANIPIEQHPEVITVEQYIKRRSNLHYYTGAGAEVGMIYYPVGEDQITYAADVSFGLKVKKFYIETGVGYRYAQERGSYKIDFKTQDSVGYYNQVTSFEISPQNPDKIILNYKKTTVYDSIEHVAYTAPLFKYDYLTIPLRIGYRFYNRKNLFVALEAGMEYNRLLKAYIPKSGFYYQDSDVVQIVNNTPERVTDNWKYLISIRVGVKLNKSISFIIQPEFSKYANSIYDVDKGYDNVKPYMMNIRAGIYYDF